MPNWIFFTNILVKIYLIRRGKTIITYFWYFTWSKVKVKFITIAGKYFYGNESICQTYYEKWL